MINKKSFIDLIKKYEEKESPQDHDYIGMGNPDSSLLLVGSEKAIDPIHDAAIMHHELFHNIDHWFDIVMHYNHLANPFDPILLNRAMPLNGFNPYNPMFFLANIGQIVGGGHTYSGMNRLINQFEVLHGLLPITNIHSDLFNENSFSKYFITELSSKPAKKQAAAKFNLKDFLISSRYNFMTGHAAEFYRDFKTTILYFGKNKKYCGIAGTSERLNVIQIFNHNLTHTDLAIYSDPHHHFEIEYYDSLKGGSRVILTRHFTAWAPVAFNLDYANAVSRLII